MQAELRKQLHSAKGESRHVVVIFLDVRGFTSFARLAESTDAADFLKCAYTTMLDRYFSDAVFFKLTGDGMLVIYEYSDAASLKRTLRKAVKRSVELVEAFPTITDLDPMVNVPVPKDLGVGLARGSATALISGDVLLDYSGRPLNLAARLMDMARPSGVVFDSSFGIDLLDKDMQDRFSTEPAYAAGVAEDEPMTVHCLAERTKIPERNKRPINRLVRVADPAETATIAELRERGSFLHHLSQEPASTDDIKVELSYPSVTADGSPHPTLRWTPSYVAEYKQKAGKPIARVNYGPICDEAEREGAGPDWTATITVEYSVVPDGLVG